MVDVLASPVLVLNRYFQPVQLTTVRRAFVLIYGGVAAAVDEEGDAYDFDYWRTLPVRAEDDALAIVGGQLRVPRIVHLYRYERVPRVTVRLSRKNIMLRDEFQCQYCGKTPAVYTDLNIDHVLPRSRGGGASWENLVTSCRPCNLRKGSKTPEESRMRLRRTPLKPKWGIAIQVALGVHGGVQRTFPEWDAYLKTA